MGDPTGLIPAPLSVRTESGHFPLTPETLLHAGPGAERAARRLRAELSPPTGLPLPHATEPVDGALCLLLDPGLHQRLGDEGYLLDVTPERATLTAAAEPGLHWAVQTLRQLLGPAAYRRAPLPGGPDWSLPALHLADAPRFRWRGLMLDVARHFMPKDGVLRILDLLAAHKLNVLHLHLTDDQGWRIEVRGKPRLTEVASWRERSRLGHRASPLWDPRPHGGYYTQEDLREIVAYAAERQITVVPEIDIPGHSQAAIAAYPELGNRDAGVDTAELGVWTDWGISKHLLAPSEEVLRFYEEVLEEVLEIFPSPYVHLGGDECPKDEWRASPSAQARLAELGLPDENALQAWMLRHFGEWLAARGRRLVGWDEILQGEGEDADPRTAAGAVVPDARPSSAAPLRADGPSGEAYAPVLADLPDGAAVSSWRGYAGGVAAARAGHDVVICPEQQVYFDHRQDAGEDEPVPIGYVRTLADVYRFEPVPPELAGTELAARVLGTQATMWAECTETPQRVDYQLFPRLVALAEVAWSRLPAPAQRDVEGFERRMERAHYPRLDAMGVNYRPPSGPYPWQRRPGVLGRPIDGAPPIV